MLDKYGVIWYIINIGKIFILGGFLIMKLKGITIASVFSVIMCLSMVSTVSADSIKKNSDIEAEAVPESSYITPFAGNGTWDLIGTRTIAGWTHGDKPVYSTGGDLKVCYTSGGNGGPYTATLAEKDYGSTDVATATLYRGDCTIFRNLNKWVDGDNKKAEFFIYFKDERTTGVTLKYYD